MAGIRSETLAATDLPFEEALQFFAQKTNVPTRKWTDIWEGAHARAFSVAGATSQALLEDFRGAIAKALETGTTLQDFRRDFDAIVKKHGWEHTGSPGWRARVIYETNLNMAFAAGRYAQMTEPVNKAVFPFWTYRHSGNKHPRLQHKAWDGLTLSADDTFWTTNYPPNGFHCGCWVEPQMRADLTRMGKTGPDPSPQNDLVMKQLKDGTIVKTPMNVDPGFGYNVGQAWKQKLPAGDATIFKAQPVAPPPPPLPSSSWPAPPSTPAEIIAADIAMTAYFGQWGGRLTGLEAEVLKDYKGVGHRVMNKVLRGQFEFSPALEQAKVLDAAIARAPAIPENMTVFRGIPANVAKLMKPGKVFKEKGFLSSSLLREKADAFAAGDPPGVVLTIRLPKGFRGAAYVHPFPLKNMSEYEMLFRAGGRFKVIDAKPGEILLEAISEPRRRARFPHD